MYLLSLTGCSTQLSEVVGPIRYAWPGSSESCRTMSESVIWPEDSVAIGHAAQPLFELHCGDEAGQPVDFSTKSALHRGDERRVVNDPAYATKAWLKHVSHDRPKFLHRLDWTAAHIGLAATLQNLLGHNLGKRALHERTALSRP